MASTDTGMKTNGWNRRTLQPIRVMTLLAGLLLICQVNVANSLVIDLAANGCTFCSGTMEVDNLQNGFRSHQWFIKNLAMQTSMIKGFVPASPFPPTAPYVDPRFAEAYLGPFNYTGDYGSPGYSLAWVGDSASTLITSPDTGEKLLLRQDELIEMEIEYYGGIRPPILSLFLYRSAVLSPLSISLAPVYSRYGIQYEDQFGVMYYDDITFNSSSWHYTIPISGVPEPSLWMLLTLGLIGLTTWRRWVNLAHP